MTTTTALKTLGLGNCFLQVDDVDAAHAFYVGVLGLDVKTDVSNGTYRWLSLTSRTHPDVEITLQPLGGGMPLSPQDESALRDLLAKGVLGALIFTVDDVDAVFEHVRASGLAEVLQEPADQFYGVRDCGFRDPAGNLVRFKSPLPA